MSTENKIAKAVGALFIITMILGMIDAYAVAPILHASLADYYSNESQFYIGAFSILFMSLGVVGIAILLYPVLDSWDRYEAAKWLTMRRWLETNPDDQFAKEVRAKLTSEPERYTTYTREYLGWGVFALMTR